MKRVNNRKFINKLTWKSFRGASTRNMIAILAIALTALLFTLLFTIGMGTVESFQRETMRQSGGDCHGTFKNLTREQYERLSQDPSIVESADCMMVADYIRNPEFLKRHVEAWYYPAYHYEHCFIEIAEGRAPESADEILMDDVSLELLGVDAKVGEKVTLQMQIKQGDSQTVDRTFTLSGIIKSDPALNVGFGIVASAYLEKYASELVYTYDQDYSNTGAIRMDVSFANSLSIQKKLDQVIVNSGYSADPENPDYINNNVNWAYVSDGGESDPVTVGAVMGGLIVIMLTGYLIIYNIFQISVIKDIRYYGLLKTIGTTGKQIKSILRRQALLLGVVGIPIGLVLGFLLGKELVPCMLSVSNYAGSEVVVSFHPGIILSATLFSLATIWISTGKPARMAAKVSPVEAVRFTEGERGKAARKGKHTTDGGKLWKMAASNLGRNKKRTILVVTSLSLAVILLNSVFTVTHSFDMETYLKKFVSTDFQIANAKYFGLDHYVGGSVESVQEEKLSESFIKACESQDGFEAGGRLYGSMATAGLNKECWKIPSFVPVDEQGNPGRYWNSKFIPLNKRDEDHYMVSLYGMEDFFYEILEVWKGDSDPQILKEKMDTGNYILSGVSVDDNGFVDEDTVMFQPGDTVDLTGEDGRERSYEVLALVKEDYYGMTNRMGTSFWFYLPAFVFKEVSSVQYLMKYSFNVADDKESAMADFIERYTTTEEPLMHYESREYWMEQFAGLTDLFTLIGGLLALVVGVIGILNFINSVLTSIVTRQQEFAMLEAIGMTRKQLTWMLILEGTYYALATIGSASILGCLFSITGVKTLSQGMWFMRYHFVIWPMLLCFPVLLLLGVAVPWVTMHMEKKESIVERLRKMEI
ncbi:MAG: FtsX-like permease family protein [Lachnospiraceae bacterium]|nr:FtsX-like permease family protein [Lachnospiraceae bacterium]